MNRNLLLIVGVIVLAIASVLGFVADDIDLRDVLALAFAGIAACFASSLVP